MGIVQKLTVDAWELLRQQNAGNDKIRVDIIPSERAVGERDFFKRLGHISIRISAPKNIHNLCERPKENVVLENSEEVSEELSKISFIRWPDVPAWLWQIESRSDAEIMFDWKENPS